VTDEAELCHEGSIDAYNCQRLSTHVNGQFASVIS
jgi:hypothetical protein